MSTNAEFPTRWNRPIRFRGPTRYRGLALFLVGIAACLSLGPMTKGVQPGANVIKRRVVVAQTIMLRSGNGTTLAFLRSFGPDRNALVFFNKEKRLYVRAEKNAPRIVLNENKLNLLNVGIVDSGSPVVSLSDGGTLGSSLRFADGVPWLSIGGGEGTGRALFEGSGPTGKSSISLIDKNGTTRVKVFDSSSFSFISLFDTKKKVRLLSGVSPEQPPEFNLYEPGPMTRLRMTEKTDGTPLLRLTDPNNGESRIFE